MKTDVFVMNIPNWRIECLVATSLTIVDVLSNDFPVLKVEHFFSKNVIGLKETIENKPGNLLAIENRDHGAFVDSIPVRYPLPVYFEVNVSKNTVNGVPINTLTIVSMTACIISR